MTGLLSLKGRTFATLVLLVFGGGVAQESQAFELGAYGLGGFDSVSSAPAEETSTGTVKPASPNPSGLYYGLGLDAELIDFADEMVGINALIGFFGAQASWETDENVFPSAISIAMMGVDLGLAPTLNFDGFLVRLYGQVGIGLFGNEYYAITNTGTAVGNSEGTTIEYEEGLLLRMAGGGGVGYQLGDLSVIAQGGLTAYTLNVTPPTRAGGTATEVQDTYTGFGAQLIVAYRFMGGTPGAAAASDSGSQEATEGGAKKKSKKKKGDKSKKKKKKKKKKTSSYQMEDFVPRSPLLRLYDDKHPV